MYRLKCLFSSCFQVFFFIHISKSESTDYTYHNVTGDAWTRFKPQKATLPLYDIVTPEILAAGTSHGRIAMWRMVVQPGNSRGDTKAQWKLQTPTEIQGNVTQLQVLFGPTWYTTVLLFINKYRSRPINIVVIFLITYVLYSTGKVYWDLLFQWGSSLNLLAANNSNTVLILCEHVMSAHFSQQVAAVQLTPTQLSITQFATGVQAALQSDIHIKGVCVTKVNVEFRRGKCIIDISVYL